MVLSAVVMAVFAVHAATYYFDGPKSEEPSGSTFFTSKYWSLSDVYTQGTSSDLTVATAGNDYIVLNSRPRTPDGSGNYTFPGESLQIGMVDGKSATIAHCGSGKITYKKLILANGGYLTWRAYDCQIDGPVEVTAPTSFNLYSTGSASSSANGGLHFYGPFTGAAGTTLTGMSQQPGYRLTFEGDMSGYKGNIKMTRYSSTMPGSGTNSVLRLAAAASIAGTVTLEEGSALQALTAEDTVSIGTLTVKDGSALIVPIDLSSGKAGLITTPNALNVSESNKLVIRVEMTINNSATQVDQPVLEFKDETDTVSLSCFVLPDDLFDGRTFVPGVRWELVAKDGAQGVKQLRLVTNPYASLKAADPMSTSGAPTISSTTNATSWTLAGAPHSGVDYFAGYSLNTAYSTKTSYQETFGGDSLSLGARLVLYSYYFSVTGTLTCLPGSGIIYNIGGAGRRTIKAKKVYVVGAVQNSDSSKDVYFQCYQNSTGLLDGPLAGTGTMRIEGRDGSGKPMGGLAFSAENDNSGFHGRMYVYVKDCKKSGTGELLGPTHDAYPYLEISATNHLGGAVEGYSDASPYYKAFELRHWGALKVTDNAAIVEKSRGVFINEHGQIFVAEGKTFAIKSPLTLSGTLHKRDAGTLELSGPLLFTVNPSDTPVANTNLVSVESGTLAVGAANALDGAAVTFATGTKLAVKRDLGAKGVVMTKALSAIAFEDDRLAVEIDAGDWTEEVAPYQFKVPLLTVAADWAPSLEDKLVVKSPFADYCVTVSTQANEDGTKTFIATCARAGMTIIFR